MRFKRCSVTEMFYVCEESRIAIAGGIYRKFWVFFSLFLIFILLGIILSCLGWSCSSQLASVWMIGRNALLYVLHFKVFQNSLESKDCLSIRKCFNFQFWGGNFCCPWNKNKNLWYKIYHYCIMIRGKTWFILLHGFLFSEERWYPLRCCALCSFCLCFWSF